MPLDDDVAFLENVPTLALLGRPALRILAIGAETKKVQSGAVLFYAGDLADCGYIVQEGGFMLEDDRRGEQAETHVGPGSLLGDLALITDTVRTETVTAQEPSVVIRIPRSLFLKMLEAYPEAARSLRDAMAERLEAWTHDLGGVREKLEKGLGGN